MRADTHLLASTDGYTTKAASSGIDARERRELEELIHGQPDDAGTLAELIRQPTGLVRCLKSTGRFAISRMLPGSADSAGRQTIAICSLVLSAKDYATLAGGDLWAVLTAGALWRRETFSGNQAVQLSAPSAPARRLTLRDVALLDAWIRARETPRGLATVPADMDQDRAILGLTSLLAAEDRCDLLWGCRLLSAQAPVQLASIVRSTSPASARRTVVEVGPSPLSLIGTAAARLVGASAIPPLRTLIQSNSPTVRSTALDSEIALEPLEQRQREARGRSPKQPAERVSSWRLAAILATSTATLIVASVFVGWNLWSRTQPPPPVQGLVAVTDEDSDSVTLRWQATAKTTLYRIERRLSRHDAWTQVGSMVADSGKDPAWTDRDLLPLDEARYRVTAISAANVSSTAKESDAVRMPPPRLSNPDVRRGDDGVVTVEWDPIRGASDCRLQVVTQPAERATIRQTACGNATFEIEAGVEVVAIRLLTRFPAGEAPPFEIPHRLAVQRANPPDPDSVTDFKLTGCPPYLELECQLADGVGCAVRWDGLDGGRQESVWDPSQGPSVRIPLSGDQIGEILVTITPFTEDAQGKVIGEDRTKKVETIPHVPEFEFDDQREQGRSLAITMKSQPPSGWQLCIGLARHMEDSPRKVPRNKMLGDSIPIAPEDLKEHQNADGTAFVSVWLEREGSDCRYGGRAQKETPKAQEASKPQSTQTPDFTIAKDFFGWSPKDPLWDLDLRSEKKRLDNADEKFRDHLTKSLQTAGVSKVLSQDKEQAINALRTVAENITQFVEQQLNHARYQSARRLLDARALMETALRDHAQLAKSEGQTVDEILKKANEPIEEYLNERDLELCAVSLSTNDPSAIQRCKSACDNWQKSKNTMAPDDQTAVDPKSTAAERACKELPCQIREWTSQTIRDQNASLNRIVNNTFFSHGGDCFGQLERIRYAAKRALHGSNDPDERPKSDEASPDGTGSTP
jgi:hypothetical protein